MPARKSALQIIGAKLGSLREAQWLIDELAANGHRFDSAETVDLSEADFKPVSIDTSDIANAFKATGR